MAGQIVRAGDLSLLEVATEPLQSATSFLPRAYVPGSARIPSRARKCAQCQYQPSPCLLSYLVKYRACIPNKDHEPGSHVLTELRQQVGEWCLVSVAEFSRLFLGSHSLFCSSWNPSRPAQRSSCPSWRQVLELRS